MVCGRTVAAFFVSSPADHDRLSIHICRVPLLPVSPLASGTLPPFYSKLDRVPYPFGHLPRFLSLQALPPPHNSNMSRFSADLQPLFKNVKFSLRQLDEASGPQCFFVCCARLADGKLVLLHCTDFAKGSSSARQDVARGMKQIYSAFRSAGSLVMTPPRSAASGGRSTPDLSVSPSPSVAPREDHVVRVDEANVPVGSSPSLPPAPSIPAAVVDLTGAGRPPMFVSPADLPRLPTGVTISKLVGGGYDSNIDGETQQGLALRSNQGARSDAVIAHRSRLNALKAAQTRVVVLPEELVGPVRLQLCRGEDRRVLLSDLYAFYELMTAYCKRNLDLTQVVYSNLAPVSSLGVTVTLKVSKSRKSTAESVPLSMGNRSRLRVPMGLALICFMVHLKDQFFGFLLEQTAAGKRVLTEKRPSAGARKTTAEDERESGAGDDGGSAMSDGDDGADLMAGNNIGGAAAGSAAVAGWAAAAGTSATPGVKAVAGAAAAGGAVSPRAAAVASGVGAAAPGAGAAFGARAAAPGAMVVSIAAVAPGVAGVPAAAVAGGAVSPGGAAAAYGVGAAAPGAWAEVDGASIAGAAAALGAATAAGSPATAGAAVGGGRGGPLEALAGRGGCTEATGGAAVRAAAATPGGAALPGGRGGPLAALGCRGGGVASLNAPTAAGRHGSLLAAQGGRSFGGAAPCATAVAVAPAMAGGRGGLLPTRAGQGAGVAALGAAASPDREALSGAVAPGRAALGGAAAPSQTAPGVSAARAGGTAADGRGGGSMAVAGRADSAAAHRPRGRRAPVGAVASRSSVAPRVSGDADVTQALGRARGLGRPRAPSSDGARVVRPPGRSRQYAHPLYAHVACAAEPAGLSSFAGRARDGRLLPDPVFSCPTVQELLSDGRVVAHGVVDASCQLVPAEDLPSRFSAVSLRSLGEGAANAPCWAWGNGALTEAFLGAVSVHTLVWETRMTGYVQWLSGYEMVCARLIA